MYTRDDPKWAKADSVKASMPGTSTHVDVTVWGETFKMCRVGWSNPQMDKTQSDVLVQTQEGDWLKVWFFDVDIEPYKVEALAGGVSDEEFDRMVEQDLGKLD